MPNIAVLFRMASVRVSLFFMTQCNRNVVCNFNGKFYTEHGKLANIPEYSLISKHFRPKIDCFSLLNIGTGKLHALSADGENVRISAKDIDLRHSTLTFMIQLEFHFFTNESARISFHVTKLWNVWPVTLSHVINVER